MHVQLLEGDGIAALAKPIAEAHALAMYANGTTMHAGVQLTIGAPPEELIEQDIVAVAHHGNLAIPTMSEAEEARILSHPDVAVAIDAALPGIEAWERA
jgi:hypothetical protein